jgi:hypothetical protein
MTLRHIPGSCNLQCVVVKVIDICPEEGGSVIFRNDGTGLPENCDMDLHCQVLRMVLTDSNSH